MSANYIPPGDLIAKDFVAMACTGTGVTANRGNCVHVHDLQATVLHQLGIDHGRLTYLFQGRDFRLTDVHGKVVRELLA